MPLRELRQNIEAEGFFETLQKIHILDGLAGSPFDQIVDGRYNDDPAGAGIADQTDVTEVAPLYGSHIRQPTRRENPYERLVPVKLPEQLNKLFGGEGLGEFGI